MRPISERDSIINGRSANRSSRFLYNRRPLNLPHKARIVHAAKLDLAGRLLARVRVEVNRKGGCVQQPLNHHVEEHRQCAHVRQLWESKALRKEAVNERISTELARIGQGTACHSL